MHWQCDHEVVSFQSELSSLLPGEIPGREECIAKAARHLELIETANQHFNLTRIVGERDAAIKHICDSIIPWRLFAGAADVADAGTGAGFPGIPLAIVLPRVRFTLLESTQKKARFVEMVVSDLELSNVRVVARRAEEWLRSEPVDIVTARAVAPLSRAAGYFAPAIHRGGRALLYKGPDADAEIAEALAEARRRQLQMQVVFRYELPDHSGTRSIVEIARKFGR
jgi:16S rRNA (guanine527-N7)-methyltransferase